jgi:hypothetical protein
VAAALEQVLVATVDGGVPPLGSLQAVLDLQLAAAGLRPELLSVAVDPVASGRCTLNISVDFALRRSSDVCEVNVLRGGLIPTLPP